MSAQTYLVDVAKRSSGCKYNHCTIHDQLINKGELRIGRNSEVEAFGGAVKKYYHPGKYKYQITDVHNNIYTL